MNEIQQNATRAIIISMAITLPLLFFTNNLIQIEREKFLIENDCFNENVACDLFPLQYLLLPISIAIYYLTFNYFEKQRKKTWRTYN